jgi:hypothetical protein
MHIGFLWKSENRLLGRSRRRWKDDMKMDLREIGWGGVDWINLAQDRDQWGGSCEHGNEPSGCIKCWKIFEYLNDWGVLKDSAPYSSLVS